MGRELPSYRDNLEQLLAYFGDKRLVYAKDVAEYCGCCSRTAAKRFNIPREGLIDQKNIFPCMITAKISA